MSFIFFLFCDKKMCEMQKPNTEKNKKNKNNQTQTKRQGKKSPTHKSIKVDSNSSTQAQS